MATESLDSALEDLRRLSGAQAAQTACEVFVEVLRVAVEHPQGAQIELSVYQRRVGPNLKVQTVRKRKMPSTKLK